MSKTESKTQLLNATADNIEVVVQALHQGDVVGLPTETVYGLAGNALDEEAIAKIFYYKSRPSFDPLIVHVPETLTSCHALAEAEIIDLKQMTQPQMVTCDQLMHRFWPGPLTIIFPKHKRISDLVTSSLDTVGLRAPAHPVAQEVLKKSKLPLAAPSANQFGRISPTKSQHVIEELGAHLNYCLEGGECTIGLESTIVRVNQDGTVFVLRPGGVSIDLLSESLKDSFQGIHKELGLPAIAAHAPMAPGLLESHYAPRKPMFRINGLFKEINFLDLKNQFLKTSAIKSAAVLSIFPLNSEIKHHFNELFDEVNFYYLAEEESDSLSGAHHLFSQLRKLDHSDVDLILCELPQSSKGLWPAICDRLSRASKPLNTNPS